jgi:hypothetical protein
MFGKGSALIAQRRRILLTRRSRCLQTSSVDLALPVSKLISPEAETVEILIISLSPRQEVEDWAYTFLEGRGIDWYNNDGGQGTITFDITASKFEYRIDVNKIFTATEDRGEEEI